MEQQQPLAERLQIPVVLYIVLTISILIGQEPPAYFENSRVFVDKHDYYDCSHSKGLEQPTTACS